MEEIKIVLNIEPILLRDPPSDGNYAPITHVPSVMEKKNTLSVFGENEHITIKIPMKQIELRNLTDIDDEFYDGYDENLFGGEDDKSWLMQLTEREREQELYNRFERRECLKRRFEIWKKLRKRHCT
ncbi:RNA polymerase-associated protein RTF1 [Trichonephila clavipes]|nr:RNA polymerase-associated protein RTF1 [Trichonephila clavipes]